MALQIHEKIKVREKTDLIQAYIEQIGELAGECLTLAAANEEMTEELATAIRALEAAKLKLWQLTLG